MAMITSYTVKKDRNSMAGFSAYENGGKGSGNFGHSGRPGQVGGSGNGKSGGSSKGSLTEDNKKRLRAAISERWEDMSADELESHLKEYEDSVKSLTGLIDEAQGRIDEAEEAGGSFDTDYYQRNIDDMSDRLKEDREMVDILKKRISELRPNQNSNRSDNGSNLARTRYD